jgi:RimJ/RimL family protein N-acetyltransferase
VIAGKSAFQGEVTLELQIQLTKSVLRPWHESDAVSLVKHANNSNVARNLRDLFPHPYTLEDAQRWFAAAKTLPPGSHFAIEVEGEAAGGIDIRFHECTPQGAEIGFWLGEAFWNRGVLSEALPVFTRHVFRNFPVQELYACVFSWNEASRRVLQKAGYRNTGLKAGCGEKGGRKVDVFDFRTRRDEWLE